MCNNSQCARIGFLPFEVAYRKENFIRSSVLFSEVKLTEKKNNKIQDAEEKMIDLAFLRSVASRGGRSSSPQSAFSHWVKSKKQKIIVMFTQNLVWIVWTVLGIAGAARLADDNVLHIGGIFPIAGEGGWQGGQVWQFFLSLFSAKIIDNNGNYCAYRLVCPLPIWPWSTSMPKNICCPVLRSNCTPTTARFG